MKMHGIPSFLLRYCWLYKLEFGSVMRAWFLILQFYTSSKMYDKCMSYCSCLSSAFFSEINNWMVVMVSLRVVSAMRIEHLRDSIARSRRKREE